MDFVIDFISVGNADAIIVWEKKDGQDIIIFVDGGKTGNGKDVIEHYNNFIKPNINNPVLIIVNSHPHADHINGLLEIVEHFENQISYAIYNDPLKHISTEREQEILDHYDEDPDINHLYEVFEKVKKLNDLCSKYSIKRIDAFSDLDYGGLFQILSPSRAFYKEKVDFFTNVANLKQNDYTKKGGAEVNEEVEGLKPCEIVDEKNDASPENLTSSIIEFTSSNGKKYLLTGDCGVDSFNSAEENGFTLNGYEAVQLPHHGSRRNVNSTWLYKLSPEFFVASADGSKKHPRKAVISCIKKNIEGCKVYSTHRGGTLSISSNKSVFPTRGGWSPAAPL